MAELVPRQVKALAIIEAVISAATAIVEAVNSVPAYKLPRIAFAARKRKAIAMAKLLMAPYIAYYRVLSISAMPIPEYPAGRKDSNH